MFDPLQAIALITQVVERYPGARLQGNNLGNFIITGPDVYLGYIDFETNEIALVEDE